MENEVNEPALQYGYIAPEEYLKRERASDIKHEYYNGYIEVVCAARYNHARITTNLCGKLFGFLDEKPCDVLTSDMRVTIPDRTAYMYPDASIVCGDPILEDDEFDTLLNPTVIFEILSRSTRKNDLGYKLQYYQQIPSIKEYIMIDSRVRYAKIIRRDGHNWQSHDLIAPDAALHIQTIDFRISFDTIYHKTGL